MKRDYDSGVSDQALFFVGREVERTPAYGMKTLFVVGVHPVVEIQSKIDQAGGVDHIFFGANHSFDPTTQQAHEQWRSMIFHFLDLEYLCSLDIPVQQADLIPELGYLSCLKFIPQIRVPIPHIRRWGPNTTIKIDDIGFRASNPGVWCHRIETLKHPDHFTDWNDYSNDTIL